MRVQEVRRNDRGTITGATIPTASAEMLLNYRDTVIRAAWTQDVGIVRVELNEIWERVKIHGIPLARCVYVLNLPQTGTNLISYLPASPDKGKDIKEPKRKDNGKYKSLGRARPVLLALLPWDLLPIPALVDPGPGQLRRGPAPHSRAF